ncbi:MAG: sigma-70 family RNA polymerase sigma factor [Ruminococcus sp.]|nr:sigma-70 family RNA polymerase sigma factor [Ruminococcus sp.]
MLAAEKNRLAESNFGLVHSCCRRFSGKGIEYEELFSAGCLGLTKAINNFDESRGLQFSTYAFPVVMGEIKRLFRDGGSVRVSRSLKELAIKISRLNNESILKSGKELSVSELSKRLEVSEEKISEAIGSARVPLSLTAEPDKDGNPQIDVPVDDIQYEISEKLTLRDAIEKLGDRDKKIINLRYYQNQTQVQTAQKLQMTQVQVSRREKKILSKIRTAME